MIMKFWRVECGKKVLGCSPMEGGREWRMVGFGLIAHGE